MSEDAVIRLAPGVSVVRRNSALLLHSRRTGHTVRLSEGAMPLLEGLQQGASLPALVQRLQAVHPQAQQVAQKIEAFLVPLHRNGMLLDGTAGPAPAARRVWPPRLQSSRADAWIAPIAELALRIPAVLRRSLLVLLLLGSVALLAALAADGRWPGLRATLENFDARGLALFAAVVVLHEACHALACRMAGAPVRAFGIVLHGGIVPGPFVDTSDASYLGSRWARWVIPAAGPVVNLLGAAACAAVLLALPADAAWMGAWRSAFVMCMAFVALDLNPFGASDGSHMLEAALDDELARQVALRPQGRTLTAAATVRWYRLACLGWLAAAAALFIAWW
jgi:putative peptide zinc metalloprotease protein